MLRLALLGKSIQHSQSEQMYREIIGSNFTYTLLDIAHVDQIPAIESLLMHYDAVNITSPYKKHFLQKINNYIELRDLGAINLIYKKDHLVLGANTDYLALIEEVQNGILASFKNFIILGDGAMAQVWKNILEQFNISFVQFSRKIHGPIENLDLSSIENALILNCCSRSFVFKGKLSTQSLFWNMNYNSPEQEILIKSLGCPYRDGSQLLKKQAIHASKLFL